MGMMMLPPVFISLPFKILLFVLVDGWNLVTGSLVESFHMMNQDIVVSLDRRRDGASRMKVALPMLLVGLVVGLVVSVFQAVTQIQEQTLSFIPKILGPRRGASRSPARGCSASSSTYTTELWPRSRRLVGHVNANALLAQFSEQQVAGFFLVLGPHRAAVPPRAAVLARR